MGGRQPHAGFTVSRSDNDDQCRPALHTYFMSDHHVANHDEFGVETGFVVAVMRNQTVQVLGPPRKEKQIS